MQCAQPSTGLHGVHWWWLSQRTQTLPIITSKKHWGVSKRAGLVQCMSDHIHEHITAWMSNSARHWPETHQHFPFIRIRAFGYWRATRGGNTHWLDVSEEVLDRRIIQCMTSKARIERILLPNYVTHLKLPSDRSSLATAEKCSFET